MRFEISGKGVVCNVYYIDKAILDKISLIVSDTGPGLKELLIKHSALILHVSKGFFADSSQSRFNCILPSGETISQSFFEEKVDKIVEYDEYFEEYFDSRDFRIQLGEPRERGIKDSEVAIIEYHNFEEGSVSVDVPCDAKEIITELKLVCESVDGYVKDGDEVATDLATTATYGEGVVGSEEYENAELAIKGLEVDGKRYLLPEAVFNKSHSRVWLWTFNDEFGRHTLDFFGSQGLPDPWTAELLNLELEELYEDFDLNSADLHKVHTFFNQQSLGWFKANRDFSTKYLESHSDTRHLLRDALQKLELPNFKNGSTVLQVCTLLCLVFEEFGVDVYDPQKLSKLDEIDMVLLKFSTLAFGNTSLLNSVRQTFCMHFDVMNIVSLGNDESFQEMSNPSLADAISFVKDVLEDPEAAFNHNDD